MVICFGGHCYEIVEIPWPIGPSRPGPGPINFPELFRDATIVASIKTAVTTHVTDPGVRAALLSGTNSAVLSLQKRGGSHITVRSDAQ